MQEPQNKKRFSTHVVIAVLVIAFCGIFSVEYASRHDGPAAAATGTATVTVGGSGEVSAAPDSASISLGCTNQAAGAREAQTANDRAVEKVIEALKAQGIPKEKIQTRQYDIWPEQNEKSQIIRYRVTHTLSVEVKNIDKVGAVLDAAIRAGANNSGGISFERSDALVLEREALKKAVADARQRAEALAGAAGKSVVRVVSIREVGTQQPPVPYMRSAMKVMDGAAESVPVEPGQLKITTAVEVEFELGG
ncbi:MAG: SIMPL domain-containing protein [Bacillota bacterium]